MACFIGRLHIYIGSWMTNCCRTEDSSPKPISSIYMFVMWFSGLRGGVAFALASVSYASNDFPQNCGGISEALKAEHDYCKPGLTDSLAILQTTLLIASFTIFVFGGAITEVAQAGKVINDGTEVDEKEPTDGFFGSKAWLTLEPERHGAKKEMSVRYEAAVEQSFQQAQPTPRPVVVTPASLTKGPTAAEIKLSMGGNGSTMSVEDKMDELRAIFPNFSADQLKTVLNEAGGDLQLAIAKGQSKGLW